jgi:hypothetical protein
VILAHLGFHSDGWKGRRKCRRWCSVAPCIHGRPCLGSGEVTVCGVGLVAGEDVGESRGGKGVLGSGGGDAWWSGTGTAAVLCKACTRRRATGLPVCSARFANKREGSRRWRAFGACRDGQLASTACEPRLAQTSCGAWRQADGRLAPRRGARPVGRAESPKDARPTTESPRSVRRSLRRSTHGKTALVRERTLWSAATATPATQPIS